MADTEKPKFDIPWGMLVPLIAMIAGIVVQYRPIVSSRPPTPAEKAVEPVAEQDVDARLWQDPFAAAEKERATLGAEVRLGSAIDPTRHGLDRLAKLLWKTKMEMPLKDRILLLCVMVDSGPYAEQGESRLRVRQAVLEGLSESGFVPKDAEHIGFVTAELPPGHHDGSLLLPFEECQPADYPARVFPPRTGRIFILWLSASDFNPQPLGRFAALVNRITRPVDHTKNEVKMIDCCLNTGDPDCCRVGRDDVDVTLIGPANSGGLRSMIQEVGDWPLQDTERDRALDGVSIISDRATVSDAALLDPSSLPFDIQPPQGTEVPPLSTAQLESSQSTAIHSLLQLRTPQGSILPRTPSAQEIIEAAIPKGRHQGLHFVRTITEDEVVLKTLIAELQRRGIGVKQKTERTSERDHIVLLSEWDSIYGRSLSTTFKALAWHLSYADVHEGWSLRGIPTSHLIDSYQYMRGVDGRLPGDLPKPNQNDQKGKSQTPIEQKPEEPTEGLDQSDFLRRLARELKKQDEVWRRHGDSIAAIGLLGSDIYDKLMILRALRPEFPDALFFTNNYDAHFERRADWADVHNLIIASPFGSRLPRQWQSHIAPFRSSSQASTFVGTLIATGRMDEDTLDYLKKHPKIFEISRHGVYDFTAPYKETHWFLDWLHSGHRKRWLVLAAIWLLVIAVWLNIAVVNPKSTDEGALRSKIKRLFCNTTFWLSIWVPSIIFGVCFFAQTHGPDAEPLAFFSGISIWPSEMLRLIAVLLAVHFMIKASFSLKENERDIARRFCLSDLDKPKFRLQTILEGLKPWQRAHPAWLKSGAEFSAEEAWHAYLRRNEFWPRFIRVVMLSLVFGSIFYAAILLLFTKTGAAIPARGVAAMKFEYVVRCLVAAAVTFLIFYVVDAIQLNGNFIRVFTRGLTNWPSAMWQQCKRIPPLSTATLPRYYDVLFVADRTQAVAPLIWYPLVVLAVLFAARSPFFDNWTWFPAFFVLSAINATWAIGGAMFLRRAAEQLRQTALEDLELARLSGYRNKEKRRGFDEVIVEIRGLKKGAFAPLSQQPFIRAIVIPGGSLGFLAVILRLFEMT